MKNWMNRFALLAVLGAVIGSAVVVGCGGSGDEEETPVANNAGGAAGAKGDDTE